MIEVTDSNFEKEILQASKKTLVLVDFWASWCGPCRMLGPMIERISKEYSDKIKFAKLNVDENQEKAQEYEIMSIPNVKLFKNGKVVDEFVGVLPEQEIKKWLGSHL